MENSEIKRSGETPRSRRPVGPACPGGVASRFPSPARDYMLPGLNLNDVLVNDPEATFYARVHGDSMRAVGIFDGDLVVVDRSITPADGDVVIACVNNEFTLKLYRVDSRRRCVWLMSPNKKYAPLMIADDDDFRVWGVVTYTVKRLRG